MVFHQLTPMESALRKGEYEVVEDLLNEANSAVVKMDYLNNLCSAIRYSSTEDQVLVPSIELFELKWPGVCNSRDLLHRDSSTLLSALCSANFNRKGVVARLLGLDGSGGPLVDDSEIPDLYFGKCGWAKPLFIQGIYTRQTAVKLLRRVMREIATFPDEVALAIAMTLERRNPGCIDGDESGSILQTACGVRPPLNISPSSSNSLSAYDGGGSEITPSRHWGFVNPRRRCVAWLLGRPRVVLGPGEEDFVLHPSGVKDINQDCDCAERRSALENAVGQSNKDAAMRLLSCSGIRVEGFEPVAMRDTQVFLKMLELGRESIVQLITRGAIVSGSTGLRETYLMHAARVGAAEPMKIILGMPGIQVNAMADKKRTALHSACRHSSAEPLRVLLRRGAYPVPDEDGWYPIHVAIQTIITPRRVDPNQTFIDDDGVCNLLAVIRHFPRGNRKPTAARLARDVGPRG